MKLMSPFLVAALAVILAPHGLWGQSDTLLFPQAVQASDAVLRLQGTSDLRVQFGLRLYTAAFYLCEKAHAGQALSPETARRIEAVYARGIRSRVLGWAARRHLDDLLSDEEMASIADRLAQIGQWFPDMRSGDRVALTYLPGRGTELEVNGVSKGRIPGEDFASAYFQIWLGDRSVDPEFTRGLMGQAR